MAKKIIILAVNRDMGGEIHITAAFWFPVETGKELPRPAMTSVYQGVTSQELTDLRAGKVIEESKAFVFPASYGRTQVQDFLQATYQARTDYLAGKPYPGEFYGAYFDGTQWIVS